MTIANGPDPILRVSVGSPIYASDDQKIGNVKEVQRSALKVGTPLWQRDYWLPAETVAPTTSNVAVILVIDRAHVEEHKLKETPVT